MADGTDPTPSELSDLALVGDKLWTLDDNRLKKGVDYKINVGQGKKTYESHDAASEPLFSFVNDELIHEKPTFKALMAIRDNYSALTGTAEVETVEERKEILDFLDVCMATRPMKYARKYLAAKGLASADKTDFKKMLYQMWFSFYRRDGQNDSCGFEHVFMGEADISTNEISGFHNWIQFWAKEKEGKLEYKGYIKPRNRGEVVDGNDRVLSCQFAWNGLLKNVTTMFLGTSPEFEMALYTIVFLAGSERNNMHIKGYELCIRSYSIKSKYGDKIGTVFPELMAETGDHHE
uniref:EndoU domain-containing protein n=1 Tax=Chlamydomonas leiostraca TaxID=1034604 RepID=A0A7S0RET2_9CHLO|mmetsp:Transcript_21033/g.53453  ORF Transcript_21033/g.53453 Transcript_21033/m.53453 type:complete len:292 (+) Transcript_21033:55-930(+)|eukprot:CAMPEP_0202866020 /NCGR_PEP_ID=MMETSP1391-20130828/7037_1 /ASSEMBLY_ACC=CAM_ASM_000867 /TAXON_ID=1034604 /ORGANISM="Chlamydomonas leiostraca, Strain SAG 11-49" /LENGTH=291 /DNA_ID=CAMNT_0049545925 /DNA_START=46 /DNA_END=921 /DNA_ORIENTATION=+